MKNLYALIPCFILFACAMPQPDASLQSLGGDQTGVDGDGEDNPNDHNYQARYYQYASLTLRDADGNSIDMELKFAERQDRAGCLVERATVCINPGSKKEKEGAEAERIEYLDLEYYQWQRHASQARLRLIGAQLTDHNSFPRLSLACDKVSAKGVHSLTSIKYAPHTRDPEDLDNNGGDGTVAVYKATVKGFSFIDRWADGHCGEVHEEDEPKVMVKEEPNAPDGDGTKVNN